ncbi:MAG: asparaginase [Pseudomonadota bacterium]
MRMNPVLVELQRGDMVESVHAGALAVLDADGGVLLSVGDIDRPVYPRSAVKMLQALPLVESGAPERLGLSDEELALACASHNGEAEHVRTAASMLAKAGADGSVLECGAHWPYDEATVRRMAAAGETPVPLHNNCSGKHSGFVCLACMMAGREHLRGFVSGYVRPGHPVMREITAALEAATGCRLADGAAPRGTDGCSIPTYGVPLRQLALAFARWGTGIGLREGHALAAARLRQAVAAAPFMVAGSGRFDTVVMERLRERVYCKVGAEGMYCAALPQRGLGIAIKMDDGNNARACEVVMASLIEALAPLDDEERGFMQAMSTLVMRNWNGIEVGVLRGSPALGRALRAAAV